MMKSAALILAVLGTILSSAAGYALTPLSKEQMEAVKQEWRSAPIHVQAEVVSSRPLRNRDQIRCGEIQAVVRHAFKGEYLLPVGHSFSVVHCLPPDIGHTTFQAEFESGRLLEAVLKPADTTTKNTPVIGIGLRLIKDFSAEPQLPWTR